MNIVEHLKEAIYKIDSDLYYLDMTGPWCKEYTKEVTDTLSTKVCLEYRRLLLMLSRRFMKS